MDLVYSLNHTISILTGNSLVHSCPIAKRTESCRLGRVKRNPTTQMSITSDTSIDRARLNAVKCSRLGRCRYLILLTDRSFDAGGVGFRGLQPNLQGDIYLAN